MEDKGPFSQSSLKPSSNRNNGPNSSPRNPSTNQSEEQAVFWQSQLRSRNQRSPSVDGVKRITVIDDNSCLFWAVALGYLLPVVADDANFINRCKKLFKKSTIDDCRHIKRILKTFQLDSVENRMFFEDEKIRRLVAETFRSAVVDSMAEKDIKAEILTYSTLDEAGLDLYLAKMHDSDTWGGEPEIFAISRLLECNLISYTDNGEPAKKYPHDFHRNHPTIKIVHTNAKDPTEAVKNHFNLEIESDVATNFIQWVQRSSEADDMPAKSPKRQTPAVANSNNTETSKPALTRHSEGQPVAHKPIREGSSTKVFPPQKGTSQTQVPPKVNVELETLSRATHPPTNANQASGVGTLPISPKQAAVLPRESSKPSLPSPKQTAVSPREGFKAAPSSPKQFGIPPKESSKSVLLSPKQSDPSPRDADKLVPSSLKQTDASPRDLSKSLPPLPQQVAVAPNEQSKTPGSTTPSRIGQNNNNQVVASKVVVPPLAVEHDEVEGEDLEGQLSVLREKRREIRALLADTNFENFRKQKEVERERLEKDRVMIQATVDQLQQEVSENVKLLSLASNVENKEPEKQALSFEEDLKRFISGQTKIELWQTIEATANKDKRAFASLNSALKAQELQSLREQLTQRSKKIEDDIEGRKKYVLELERKINDTQIEKNKAQVNIASQNQQKALLEQSSRAHDANIAVHAGFIADCDNTLRLQSQEINTRISQLKAFRISTMSRGGPFNLARDNYIQIDGANLVFNPPIARGVNIAIIDAYTGECKQTKNFDTHRTENPQAQNAIAFIRDHFLPQSNRLILVIICADEMTGQGIEFARFMRNDGTLRSTRCPITWTDDDYRRPWSYIYDNGPIESAMVARNKGTEELNRDINAHRNGEIDASRASINHTIDRVHAKTAELESERRQFEAARDAQVAPKNSAIKDLREKKLNNDMDIERIVGIIGGENARIQYCDVTLKHLGDDKSNTQNEIVTKQGILNGYYALLKEYEQQLTQTDQTKSVEQILAERDQENRDIAEKPGEKEAHDAIRGMIKAVEEQRVKLENEISKLKECTNSISTINNELSHLEDTHLKFVHAQERALKETETAITLKEEEIRKKSLEKNTLAELQLMYRNCVISGVKANADDSLIKKLFYAILPVIYNDQQEFSFSDEETSVPSSKYVSILPRLILAVEKKVKEGGFIDKNVSVLEKSNPQRIFDTVTEVINDEYRSDGKQFRIRTVGALNKLQASNNTQVQLVEIDLCKIMIDQQVVFCSILDNAKGLVNPGRYLFESLTQSVLPVVYQYVNPKLSDLEAIRDHQDYQEVLKRIIEVTHQKLRCLFESSSKSFIELLETTESERPSLIRELVLSAINEEYQSFNVKFRIKFVNNPDAIRPIRKRTLTEINLCHYQGSFLSAVDKNISYDDEEIYGWGHRLLRIFVYNDNRFADNFFEFHFEGWGAQNNVFSSFKKAITADIVKYHTEISAKLFAIKDFMELHRLFYIDKPPLKGQQNARVMYDIFNKLCDHVAVHFSRLSARQHNKLLSFAKNGLAAILKGLVQTTIQERNKQEEAKIEYNQDPIARLEKQLESKFAELEALKSDLDENQKESEKNEAKTKQVKTNKEALDSSRHNQEQSIREEIQAKEKEIKELTAQKYLSTAAIKEDTQKNQENDAKNEEVTKKLEILRAEKDKLEKKLAEARDEEKECAVKDKVLTGELNADVLEVERVKSFKAEEEKKLRSLCIQLLYIRLLRFSFKRDNVELLKNYAKIRNIVAAVKLSSESLENKFNALRAKLIATGHFSLLNDFYGSAYDPNSVGVGSNDRNALNNDVGTLFEKLSKLNGEFIITAIKNLVQGQFKTSKSTSKKFNHLCGALKKLKCFTFFDEISINGIVFNEKTLDDTDLPARQENIDRFKASYNKNSELLITITIKANPIPSTTLLNLPTSRDIVLDPVFFNQMLDILTECVREPEISNVVAQQESSAVQFAAPMIPLLCEINGFNINVLDVIQLLEKEVSNKLFLLGLKIENGLLVTYNESPFLGFSEYPQALQVLLSERIETQFPSVNGAWAEKNALRDQTKGILDTLRIDYASVLRAFFNDIEVIAGNDIYLNTATNNSILFPGISLTFQAENNIYTLPGLTISTAGNNGLPFSIQKARSGIDTREKVDKGFVDHQLKLYLSEERLPQLENGFSFFMFGNVNDVIKEMRRVMIAEIEREVKSKSYKPEGWPTGKAGENGLKGKNGQNGGDLSLRAKRGIINNRDALKLITSGGNGAKGQDGGDGDEGTHGYDTPDALVKDTDGMGPRQLNVGFARLPGKGPNNEDRPEELGGPGGKGGNAGKGGKGGLVGKITFEDREFIGDITALANYQQNIQMKAGIAGESGAIGIGAIGGLDGRQGLDRELYKNSFWDRTAPRSGKFDDSYLTNPSKLDRGDFKFHIGGCGTKKIGPTESYRGQINLWGYGEPLPMIKSETQVRTEVTNRNATRGENGHIDQTEINDQNDNRNLANEVSHKLYLGRKANELSKSVALQLCEKRANQQMAEIEAEIDVYNARIAAGEQRIGNKKQEIAENQHRLNAAAKQVANVDKILTKVNSDIDKVNQVGNLNNRDYADTLNKLFHQQQRLASISLELQKSTIDKQSFENLDVKLKSVYDSLSLILKQEQKRGEVTQEKIDENKKLLGEKLQLIEVEISSIQKMLEALKNELGMARRNKKALNQALMGLHQEQQTQKDQQQEEVKLLMDHHLPKVAAGFTDLLYSLEDYPTIECARDKADLLETLVVKVNGDLYNKAVKGLKSYREALLKRSAELGSQLLNLEERLARLEFCLYCIFSPDDQQVFKDAKRKILQQLKLSKISDLPFDSKSIQAMMEQIDVIYPFFLADFKVIKAPLKGFFMGEHQDTPESFSLYTHRLSTKPSEFELLMRAYLACSKTELINIAINHLHYYYADIIHEFRQQISEHSGIEFNLANFMTYLLKVKENEGIKCEQNGNVSDRFKRLKALYDLLTDFYLSGHTKTFKKLRLLCELYSDRLGVILNNNGSALGIVAGHCTSFVKFVKRELDQWVVDKIYLTELDHLKSLKFTLTSKINSLYRSEELPIDYKPTGVKEQIIKKWKEKFKMTDNKSKERITPTELETMRIKVEIDIELGKKLEEYNEIFDKDAEKLREYLLTEMSRFFNVDRNYTFFDVDFQKLYSTMCSNMHFQPYGIYNKAEFLEVLAGLANNAFKVKEEAAEPPRKAGSAYNLPSASSSFTKASGIKASSKPPLKEDSIAKIKKEEKSKPDLKASNSEVSLVTSSNALDKLEVGIKRYIKYLPFNIEKIGFDYVKALKALAKLMEITIAANDHNTLLSALYELGMVLEDLCCRALYDRVPHKKDLSEHTFTNVVRTTLQSRTAFIAAKSSALHRLFYFKAGYYQVLFDCLNDKPAFDASFGDLLFYLDFNTFPVFDGNIESKLRELISMHFQFNFNDNSFDYLEKMTCALVIRLAKFTCSYERWKANGKDQMKTGAMASLSAFIMSIESFINSIDVSKLYNKTLNQNVLDVIFKIYGEALILELAHQFNSSSLPANERFSFLRNFVKKIYYQVIIKKFADGNDTAKQVNEDINKLLMTAVVRCEQRNIELIELLVCEESTRQDSNYPEKVPQLRHLLFKLVNLHELQLECGYSRHRANRLSISFKEYIDLLNQYFRFIESGCLDFNKSQQESLAVESTRLIQFELKQCVSFSMAYLEMLRKKFGSDKMILPLLYSAEENLNILMVSLLPYDQAFQKLQMINVLLDRIASVLENNSKLSSQGRSSGQYARENPPRFMFFSGGQRAPFASLAYSPSSESSSNFQMEK